MAIERYIAAAGLGLFAMFVGEILTLYDFLIDPIRMVEPSPKILQFISIGAAPAFIMAGVAFIMSKRYGSRPIAYMIMSGGAVMLVGMAYANTMLERISPEYLTETVSLVPPLFLAASIPVIAVGALLLRINKRRPKKEYV